MALLWLFDAAFVAVDAAFALVKYACQAAAHYRAMQGEAHGEVRAQGCPACCSDMCLPPQATGTK
jgi:hypothetical protein